MIILSRTENRLQALAMLASGAAAGTLLTATGIPIIPILLASAMTAAYALGWRLSIKRTRD